MARLRQELAQTPAAVVVANHAYGLWELAAIHLSEQPPNLSEASVAVDALAALVDVVGDRLGETAAPLLDALHQIRLAFVQISAAAGRAQGGGPPPTGGGSIDSDPGMTTADGGSVDSATADGGAPTGGPAGGAGT